MDLGKQKPQYSLQEITSELDGILEEQKNLELGWVVSPDVDKLDKFYEIIKEDTLEDKEFLSAAEKLHTVLKKSTESAADILIFRYRQVHENETEDMDDVEEIKSYSTVSWSYQEFRRVLGLEKELRERLEKLKDQS